MLLVKKATINSGQSLSGVVDTNEGTIIGIHMPSAWTAASLTFQASADLGSAFFDVYTEGGTEYSIPVAASRFIKMNPVTNLPHIKIRSGTSGTPVNQAATRDIFIVIFKQS